YEDQNWNSCCCGGWNCLAAAGRGRVGERAKRERTGGRRGLIGSAGQRPLRGWNAGHQRGAVGRRGEVLYQRGRAVWRACGWGALLEGLCRGQVGPIQTIGRKLRRAARRLSQEPLDRRLRSTGG